MSNITYKGQRLLNSENILEALRDGRLDLRINGHIYAARVGYATYATLAVIACPHPAVHDGGLTTVLVSLLNGEVADTLCVEGAVDAPENEPLRWRPQVLFLEGPPSRIPEYSEPKHLVSWVLEMRRQGLVFHPDDDIREDDRYNFTLREILDLDRILPLLKKDWGDDFYNLLHVLAGGPDGP